MFTDFVYVSLIEPAPGGKPARSTSRLATADGYLQYSTELNNGVLLDLRVLQRQVPYLLDHGKNIDAKRVVQSNGAGDAPLADLLPGVTFLARAEAGVVTTAEGPLAEAAGPGYRRYTEGFDRAMRLPQARPAKAGLYVLSAPYLGRTAPDFQLDVAPPELLKTLSRPYRFVACSADCLQQVFGRSGAEAGESMVVEIASSAFVVTAYELLP